MKSIGITNYNQLHRRRRLSVGSLPRPPRGMTSNCRTSAVMFHPLPKQEFNLAVDHRPSALIGILSESHARPKLQVRHKIRSTEYILVGITTQSRPDAHAQSHSQLGLLCPCHMTP